MKPLEVQTLKEGNMPVVKKAAKKTVAKKTAKAPAKKKAAPKKKVAPKKAVKDEVQEDNNPVESPVHDPKLFKAILESLKTVIRKFKEGQFDEEDLSIYGLDKLSDNVVRKRLTAVGFLRDPNEDENCFVHPDTQRVAVWNPGKKILDLG